MDDILVISENKEQHYIHLERIFEILLKNDVVVRKRRCEFLKTEIEFLGFMSGPEGLLPNPSKVEDILKMPIPQVDDNCEESLALLDSSDGLSHVWLHS